MTTIDASHLPQGLVIDGQHTVRLFRVHDSSTLNLTAVSLTRGIGIGASRTMSGGAIYNTGTLNLARCTLTENFVTSNNVGGALLSSGRMTLTHCTLMNNSAFVGVGGGIYNLGVLSVTHCTIAENSGISGGGIYNNPAGSVTLAFNLIANNSSNFNPDVFNQGSLTAHGVNFLGNADGSGLSAGPALLTGNPLLAPLANNGGPTQTISLLPGSPAIDAASGSTATTDQRGQPQFNCVWDLGAFESHLGIRVTTTADSGAGSLRQALLDAAANPGADTITFAPILTGTITLGSELIISDNGGVTINGSAVQPGISLSGSNARRLFTVNSGCSLTLKNLTLTGGNSTGGAPFNGGGAIFNNGALTLERCTLTGNNGGFGGAIFNESSGTLLLDRCTLAGNGISQEGGALWNRATATLTHCTISNNNATNFGGILNDNNSTLRLVNTIVAGNAGAQAADIFNRPTGTLTRSGTSLIGSAIAGGGTVAGSGIHITAAPLLAALDHYGGPTKTMALLPDSPARDAAPSPNLAPNASFETDTFGGSFSYTNSLGGGAITGWTSSPSSRTGLCINGSPFANGGVIPDGSKAAFLQCTDGQPTTLSTTLTGLTIGRNYSVTFRTTSRADYTLPVATWSVNGGAPVAFDASTVGAGNPYRTFTGTFTATATTADLVFTNQTAINTDSSLLLDAITVVPTVASTDQRCFPIVGLPDIGAYEAGTLTNFNAYIWETLPATATTPQHATTFDFDGDGKTNEAEWLALTDPSSAASVFLITNAVQSGPNLVITFPSVTGRTYTLWQSDTLTGAWSDSGQTAISGDGSAKTFTIPVPGNGVPKRFHRVQVGP